MSVKASRQPLALLAAWHTQLGTTCLAWEITLGRLLDCDHTRIRQPSEHETNLVVVVVVVDCSQDVFDWT